MPFRFCLILGFCLLESAAFAGEMLHQNRKACQQILAAPKVRLHDLVEAGIVEPDNRYLSSPVDETHNEHEYRTALLLAARLRTPIAFIPALSGVNVPTVDGIIFDKNGDPTHNFSLKTFMPSKSSGGGLNDKLRDTIDRAKEAVDSQYSAHNLRRVVTKYLDPSVSLSDRRKECEVQSKIFGWSHGWYNEPNSPKPPPRPVVLVIDYTLDRSAIFRDHGYMDENDHVVNFLTLNGYEGLSIKDLMLELRAHPTVKEFVFVSPHNMFHIRANGYQMTEFCDHLGHAHDHDLDDDDEDQE
jgi:hypothetical protein